MSSPPPPESGCHCLTGRTTKGSSTPTPTRTPDRCTSCCVPTTKPPRRNRSPNRKPSRIRMTSGIGRRRTTRGRRLRPRVTHRSSRTRVTHRPRTIPSTSTPRTPMQGNGRSPTSRPRRSPSPAGSLRRLTVDPGVVPVKHKPVRLGPIVAGVARGGRRSGGLAALAVVRWTRCGRRRRESIGHANGGRRGASQAVARASAGLPV